VPKVKGTSEQVHENIKKSRY